MTNHLSRPYFQYAGLQFPRFGNSAKDKTVSRTLYWKKLLELVPDRHELTAIEAQTAGLILNDGAVTTGTGQAVFPGVYYDNQGLPVLGIVPTGPDKQLTYRDFFNFILAIEKAPHLESLNVSLLRRALFDAYQNGSLSWPQRLELSKTLNERARMPVLKKLGLVPGGPTGIHPAIFTLPILNGPMQLLKSDLDLWVKETDDGKTALQNYYELIHHVSQAGFRSSVMHSPKIGEAPLATVFESLDVVIWYPEQPRDLKTKIHSEFGYIPPREGNGAETLGEVVSLWNKLTNVSLVPMEEQPDLFEAYLNFRTAAKATYKALKATQVGLKDQPDLLKHYFNDQDWADMAMLRAIKDEAVAPDQFCLGRQHEGIFRRGASFAESLNSHSDPGSKIPHYMGLTRAVEHCANLLLKANKAVLDYYLNLPKAQNQESSQQAVFVDEMREQIQRLQLFINTYGEQIEHNTGLSFSDLSPKLKKLNLKLDLVT